METVKVKDNLSEEILFEGTMEQLEKAYKIAAEYEQMGLDVTVLSPSLPETLIDSLGASESEKEVLRKEVLEEIDSHNSCCFEDQNP